MSAEDIIILVIANIVGNCYHQGKYYIAGNTFKINFYEED